MLNVLDIMLASKTSIILSNSLFEIGEGRRDNVKSDIKIISITI